MIAERRTRAADTTLGRSSGIEARGVARCAPARGPLRPLSVAPMMACTDRHYRFFVRQLTRRTLLYSEMVTARAVLFGDTEQLIGFDPRERPLALQLGGDDPRELARCARIAEQLGYDELNLNVGCPSDRVQRGNFGACLMAEPRRVADCVAAMRAVVRCPVTVKHRIGIDGLERYEDLERFVDTVSRAGCDRFTVHARIAVLGGLSPKQNRSVPPLRYDDVHRLKRSRPDLRIEINGGIRTLDQARAQLEHVDGVMIGRAAYEQPLILAGADREIFGDERIAPSPRQALEAMIPYLEAWCARGLPAHHITRHMLGLFCGIRGARAYRRTLSGPASRKLGPGALLQQAVAQLPAQALDVPADHGIGSPFQLRS